MRFIFKHDTAIIAAAFTMCAGPLYAQTSPASGVVNAQLELISGCAIEAGGGSAQHGGNFGALNFGAQPGTFTGNLYAQVSGSAGQATKITCTEDIGTLNVTVDAGDHPNGGAGVGVGTRALYNESEDAWVPYEVYSDSTHSTAYPTTGDAVAITIGTPGAAFDLPIYGVANKTSPNALSDGVYVDKLNVTLTW